MSRRVRAYSLFALGALFALMIPLLVACGPEAASPTTAGQAATAPAAAPTAPAAATTAPGGQATAAPTTAAAQPAASPGGAARPSGSPTAAGGDQFPSGGKNSTLEAVGRKGGHITEVSFADAATMNPMLSSDTASGAVIAMVFSGLVNLNPDTGLPFGDLAAEVPSLENGGISKDGLTYTFKLKRDVKFHDGQPLTAKDVVFTYQTMMKRETASPRTSILVERIDSVSASDDYTVVFKMKKIVAPFLVTNASYGIVPEHILKDVAPDQIKSHPLSTGDPSRTIGSGPFKFKEWVKDDHITLTKNAAYFRGEPALDEYVFKVVKDQSVIVSQLKTGEADYGAIQKSFFQEMQGQQNVSALVYDAYSFTYYAYNNDAEKTPLFQDKRVRQALLWALDRKAMSDAIYFGLATVAPGTMPVPSWAYAPDKMRTDYKYDPQRAEQLLDEAGWRKGGDGIRAKDGQRLAFTIWTNAGNNERAQLVTVMQQQWRAIGVDATPKTEEWNAFLDRLDRHDYEVYLVGFSWGIDPDQQTFWSCDAYTGGFNDFKYCNRQVDELLDKGVTELDQEKRKQYYIDFQNIIMEDVPAVILNFPQTTVALNKRVKNMYPNAIVLRWNAHTWWVTDGR